jgi:hypothetical protein
MSDQGKFDDLPMAPSTILIDSIDFAPSIEADIRRLCPGSVHRLAPISDLIERKARANSGREDRL